MEALIETGDTATVKVDAGDDDGAIDDEGGVDGTMLATGDGAGVGFV